MTTREMGKAGYLILAAVLALLALAAVLGACAGPKAKAESPLQIICGPRCAEGGGEPLKLEVWEQQFQCTCIRPGEAT